ncbi:MAG: hypothetical protein FWE28_09440 [Oscillospiraceae bacterium]|nr:hypothetical protein [Oscillospiraceae bacterium]
MKNINNTLYLVLTIAGLMIVYHAVDIVLTHREEFSHFLWLFVWVAVTVWVLASLYLVKKRNSENRNGILHFGEKIDALNVKKYIWLIRILLAFLWFRVVGLTVILSNVISTNFILGNMLPEEIFDNHILQENMFGIHELVGAGLQLFTGLIVAILVSIYFMRRKSRRQT